MTVGKLPSQTPSPQLSSGSLAGPTFPGAGRTGWEKAHSAERALHTERNEDPLVSVAPVHPGFLPFVLREEKCPARV